MFTFIRPALQRAVVLLCAVLLAGTWGCFKHNGPCPVVTLTVTPNPVVLSPNATQQFVATARDIKGNILPNPSTWSVGAGGTINSSGLFTAGTLLGTYANAVRAANGGLTSMASVIVVSGGSGPLASITVTPNPTTLAVNGTQTFVAIGTDANDNVVAFTPTWSVVAGGGSINSGGVFTAGTTVGTFSNTVRATSGSLSGFATVIVTSTPPPPSGVLGSAQTFAVLGGSTVTNVGATTTITGDVGVSPGTAITGLPGGQPTGGAVHAADGIAAAAQADLTIAYNDLAGRSCGTNLTSVDLGGMTLAPGVYCFNTSAALTGALTLDAQGNSGAVFVIQVGSTLTTASNATVTLIGGALANNVYWQVGSSATLGTNTAFIGNIVALQAVTLTTGATLSGRALARNAAVTLDANAVTLP